MLLRLRLPCQIIRIHLHFDSFPVSGTTTTLDSLAMGIPVLTSPLLITQERFHQQYLNMLGLLIMSVRTQANPQPRSLACRSLPFFCSQETTALQVRQSAICDDQFMPSMFVDQLQQMLRQSVILNARFL